MVWGGRWGSPSLEAAEDDAFRPTARQVFADLPLAALQRVPEDHRLETDGSGHLTAPSSSAPPHSSVGFTLNTGRCPLFLLLKQGHCQKRLRVVVCEHVLPLWPRLLVVNAHEVAASERFLRFPDDGGGGLGGCWRPGGEVRGFVGVMVRTAHQCRWGPQCLVLTSHSALGRE